MSDWQLQEEQETWGAIAAADTVPRLTSEGARWASNHLHDSMVARVALLGDEWPATHRATAIDACNAAARS